MKILRTDNSRSEYLKKRNFSFRNSQRGKADADEFRRVLDQILAEQSEELEEFRVLLPKKGNFWDNGYEDLE
jgi:uncharacterized protein YecA (UPF0149 family)